MPKPLWKVNQKKKNVCLEEKTNASCSCEHSDKYKLITCLWKHTKKAVQD